MHHFDWFSYFGANPHLSHVFGAAFVVVVILLMGLAYRASLKSVEQEVIPDSRVSLKNVLQMIIEGMLSLLEGVVGKDQAKNYLPLVAGIFLYVFLNNILGSIPGFPAPTTNLNTNLAVSVIVFLYYNYHGIKSHGVVNYLKHFMGPVIWLAPLLFAIEIVSHVVRPVTLGVRLFLNITGDHIILGIFSDLVPIVLPVIFMAFGIFVSFVQAFVFTLLSMVYIGLATSHADHAEAHH